MAGGAVAAYGGRPVSAISRSHVPSLTSHAFFHPMSSQKLQAQRGSVTRPRLSQLGQPQPLPPSQEAGAIEPAVASAVPQPFGGQQATGPFARPISRGSEYTDQMTVDRITANTSPTGAFYPPASLSDSVRPLHQRSPSAARTGMGTEVGGLAETDVAADDATDREMPGASAGGGGSGRGVGLSIRVDKNFKSGNVGSLPTPVRTPKSFRSSFMLAGKGGSGGDGAGVNRDIQGGEKLESVASTPQRSHSGASRPSNGTPVNGGSVGDRRKMHGSGAGGKSRGGSKRWGKNYEFFQGNTVFCLGGRFENTKSRPINIATGTMVIVPCVLFFVFSAPWLWHNVSPAMPVTFAYVFYICVSSFFHASLTDPGVSFAVRAYSHSRSSLWLLQLTLPDPSAQPAPVSCTRRERRPAPAGPADDRLGADQVLRILDGGYGGAR